MIERQRLAAYPFPPRHDPGATAAFVARLQQRLRLADDDGLLPWGANAREDLLCGNAIGIKAAGSIVQPDAVNVMVDGEALGLRRYVVCLFPQSLAWIVAQDPTTPREFTGSNSQMAYVLHQLHTVGLMPPLKPGGDDTKRRPFGLSVSMRGFGSIRLLPLCSRILTETFSHG